MVLTDPFGAITVLVPLPLGTTKVPLGPVLTGGRGAPSPVL